MRILQTSLLPLFLPLFLTFFVAIIPIVNGQQKSSVTNFYVYKGDPPRRTIETPYEAVKGWGLCVKVDHTWLLGLFRPFDGYKLLNACCSFYE
jgi:hypothetical protein